ncbi:MAG: integrase core domain-containing protein [Caulobacteraceae bacterium]
MDQRVAFIGDCLSGSWTMSELCERYEISRKTGYKWLERYRLEGAAGLAERSKAPLAHGRSTPEPLVEAIVGLRRERPSWGPRKIIAKLRAGQPGAPWPVASTAGEILKRAGLVSGRRLRRRGPPRLYELTAPQYANHVWAVDHKGWVRLLDGSRAEPLTMTDGFSRYLISLTATASTAHAEARPLFEQAFEEHGLPEVIRSDNGAPFASTGVSGLTALSAWWIKLGIRHEKIDPGHPQQNGRHERFHLTLLEAMRPAEPNRTAQERRFAAFAHDYNHERPHEALGQRAPASLYQPSPRPMPTHPPEPDYPAEAAVRRVRSNGEIKWRGELIHVCSALGGEAVAVEETDDGQWRVRYFATPLGIIDTAKRKLRRPFGPVHGAEPTHTET